MWLTVLAALDTGKAQVAEAGAGNEPPISRLAVEETIAVYKRVK